MCLFFFIMKNLFLTKLRPFQIKKNFEFWLQQDEIKLVKILQELAESKPKAYPKQQRDRWTNIS